MAKQNILTISKESGWITKIKYRKSMDDFVITQKNKEMRQHRFIYLFGEGVSDKIIKFMEEIKKVKKWQ